MKFNCIKTDADGTLGSRVATSIGQLERAIKEGFMPEEDIVILRYSLEGKRVEAYLPWRAANPGRIVVQSFFGHSEGVWGICVNNTKPVKYAPQSEIDAAVDRLESSGYKPVYYQQLANWMVDAGKLINKI